MHIYLRRYRVLRRVTHHQQPKTYRTYTSRDILRRSARNGNRDEEIWYFQFPGYFSVTVFFLKSKNVKTILFLYHHLSSFLSICTQSSISCISFVSSVLFSFILFVFLLKFFLPFLVCFFPTPLKMMDHQPTMCHVRIFAIGP